jgi:transcription elongation GreA/GreB family factor
MKITIAFKKQLIEHCKTEVQKRINNFTAAMIDAQESANSEDKSSAGDKYETGRAMSQISRDMHAKQLRAAKIDYEDLMNIDATIPHKTVQKGALVKTQNGQYIFIAASIGLIDFEGDKIAFVSVKAPIALALLNKKIGDEVLIAQKKDFIEAIA